VSDATQAKGCITSLHAICPQEG